MPVYIRKGPLQIPTPSEKNWSDDEGECYLTDPEKAHDHLPQPFRMIDRLVDELLEQASAIIQEKEEKKEAERTRAKPTLCQPSTEIQISGKVNCVAAGGAGRCIFVGLSVGVAVFSLPGGTWICGWETGSIEICTICAAYLGGQTYVLATVDDMGVARLFYFHTDSLFLIKAVNEMEDVSKRTICTNVEISQGGDYAGFLLEGDGESWLEIYRLPKDSWLKELEHIRTTPEIGSTTVTAIPVKQEKTSLVVSSPTMEDIQLNAPTVIMKIKPPRPVTGSSFKSPMEAVQKSDDCSVFGSGQNHLISAHQWEQQEALFCREFEKYLQVENPEMGQDNKPSRAVFHFLLPSKMLPTGVEKVQPGLPNSISVQWSGNHNFFLYVLMRPSKEKADAEPKPDVVWPCAAPIVCSTLSSSSAYLALGFEDGSITVWDMKYSGSPLAILALPEEHYFQSLYFLERPTPVGEQILMDSFPASPRVQLLTWCTNGSLYLITAAAGKETNMVMLRDSPEDADDRISALIPISKINNAALVFFRNGIVELMNCAERETICQFVTPSAYILASPWKPVFTMDQENMCLIFTGDQRLSAVEMGDAAACSLLLFSFDSYPFMDSVKNDESTPAPPQLLLCEKRCQIYLQNRIQSFAARAIQQQDSWKRLQDYADEMQKTSKDKQKPKFCKVAI